MKLDLTSCKSVSPVLKTLCILSLTLITTGCWSNYVISHKSGNSTKSFRLEKSPQRGARGQNWLQRPGIGRSSTAEPPVNVTNLLISRFQYLFPSNANSQAPDQQQVEQLLASLDGARYQSAVDDHKVLAGSGVQDEESLQSILETRKIEQEAQLQSNAGSSQSDGSQHQMSADCEFQRRNYFKILDRVFSRVELPDVFKTSRLKGSHCGLHIGCIEEIPNFPSLLKKANVSATFSIYTRPAGRPEAKLEEHRIHYEPIVHHQLQDVANVSGDLASQLHERLKEHLLLQAGQARPKSKRQTASSWRSAARIAHSQEYPFDLAALEQSGFNASANTRIIVGGYFAKEDEEWIDEVVRQWSLLEPQGNIVKVSWQDANRGLYHTAAYNSRIIGRQLTLFLYYLDQMFHIDLDKFHLVGHSLGAHIAGFAGADHEGRIARITGLDPAGPIFVELNASLRLDPTDAQFVDVLHTNGGTITKGALGLSVPSGHADYYCNGGSAQPGCYFSSVTKSIMDPVERVACSHRRSYRYFIEITKLAINELAGHTQPRSLGANLSLATQSGKQVCHECALAHMPMAFLFEAKQDDLVRLLQPEIVLMSSSLVKRELADLAPVKRRLEFHLLKPEFPAGRRGLYFFKTRSESPFFATKQYALVLRTDTFVRRKIALLVRIDQTLVAEAELDEIPGIYTLAFAPNDQRLINMTDTSRPPHLSIMWKYRSFNLLLNQQSELHFSSIELTLLDAPDSEHAGQVVRFSQVSHHSSSNNPMRSSAGPTDLALVRNQWHRFEGRTAKTE